MAVGGTNRRGAATLATAVVLAAIATAPHASAQEAPEPIAVDYDAPSGCPDRAAFFGEVTARTPRARAATSGDEKARVLHVRVEKRGEKHAGRLWIEENGASGTAREVSGGSCAEVVGALGLVAALAVDPRASVAPRPAPAAPTDAASGKSTAGTGNPSPEPSNPAREPAREPTKPADPAREADRPSVPRPPSPPQPRHWSIGAGTEISGLADVVVGVRVFGEIDLGGRLFAPSIRIAGARTFAVDRPAAIGSASLAWTTGAIEVCPLRLDLARTVAARPCAGIAAGALQANGSGVATPRDETRAWVAASAHARLVWAPVRALGLELEGGAAFPLLRESFFFDPNVLVYEAPVIAGFGRASVALRFF